jgi:molecular chaperone DnaJ
MSNYYLALGVSKEADLHKIKKAYRIFCKKYHPDISTSLVDKRKFLKIQEAYETLSDSEKRKKYDESLNRKDIRINANWENVKKRKNFSSSIERFHTFVDDFFEGLVAGLYEESLTREKELFLELILSPEEARNGGAFPIDIPILEPCPECRETGVWLFAICPLCHGYGKVKSSRSFMLHVPPGVSHGTQVRVPLEGIGLENVALNVDIILTTAF